MSFGDYFKYTLFLEEAEETSGPKAKLSYLEDLIIERGKDGFNMFKTQIEQLLNRFKGLETDQVINAKIDGSPGILFGFDPRPNYQGQFFVGVGRSINGARKPKAIHNEQELNEFVENEELKKTLKSLLVNLRSVYDNSGNIYQADVLFTNHMQKGKEVIDGLECLVFTPNLLTYAIPVDPKSELYTRMVKAEVAIIVHDVISGSTDSTGEQILLNSIGKNIVSLVERSKATGRVFIEGSTYGDVSFNVPPVMFKTIDELVSKAETSANKIDDLFNQQWITHPVLKKLHKYIGDQIKRPDGGIFSISKEGKKLNIKKLYDEFVDHLMVEYKSISKRKEIANWLLQGKTKISLQNLLAVFFYIRNVSDMILDILYNMESKLGKSFIRLPDGSYQASRGEGFVLFHGSNHAKLVDRLDFTKGAKLYSKYNL